jgi:hypothetical protein
MTFYKQTREYIGLFRKALPDANRDESILTLHAIHYAAVNSKQDVAARIAVLTFLLVIVVPSFTYVVMHRDEIYYILHFRDATAYKITGSAQLCLLFFLICLWSLIYSSGQQHLAMIFCAITLFTMLSTAIYAEYQDIMSTSPDLSALQFGVVIAIGLATTAIIYLAYFGFISIIFSYILELSKLVFSRRQPDAALFFLLCSMLVEQMGNKRSWNDPMFKRKAISNLDRAANLVDRALVFRLTSRASYGRTLANSQLRLIAAGLRTKILWVLTPMEHAREDLIYKLQEFIRNLALGRWDLLIEGDAGLAAVPPSGLTNWLLRIGLSLAIGAAPFLGLKSYLWFGDPLSQQLKDYAGLSSMLWFAACVLSEIDPRWSERIGGLKEAISIVKPLGGGLAKD